MKVCAKCGSSERTTRGDECKLCVRMRSRKYRAEHPERVKRTKSEWQKSNQDKVKAAASKYDLNHPDGRRNASLKWFMKNKDKARASRTRWVALNSDRVKSVKAAWNRANPHMGRKYNHRRRAIERNAIPLWFCDFDDFVFQESVDLCARRKRCSGIDWEIDHIIPLNSNFVCGLHWRLNWRVIPKTSNRSKGNRQWPDCP